MAIGSIPEKIELPEIPRGHTTKTSALFELSFVIVNESRHQNGIYRNVHVFNGSEWFVFNTQDKNDVSKHLKSSHNNHKVEVSVILYVQKSLKPQK